MVPKSFASFFFLSFLIVLASAKVYKRCELARELKNVHKANKSQLATWVCIANYESNYNTTTVSKPNKNGSRDHGIFQINDKYWCYPTGKGCGLPCSKMQDDKIGDDFQCAKKIFKETKKARKNGFLAWTTYKKYCKGSKAKKFIKGCF